MNHEEHIREGYFLQGCIECERFVGWYLICGRKFKKNKILQVVPYEDLLLCSEEKLDKKGHIVDI